MSKEYDKRHGGPYDRGAADSYYRRGFNPHYFKVRTYMSDRVTDLTPEEMRAYAAGYRDNEDSKEFKDWEL